MTWDKHREARLHAAERALFEIGILAAGMRSVMRDHEGNALRVSFSRTQGERILAALDEYDRVLRAQRDEMASRLHKSYDDDVY